MAMKEQYYTVDGQMIGYKNAGGRKDFLTDALGSVTAEVDQTGATKTFDGRYKPYGGDLSSTGTRGSYGWVGAWGYRGTGLSASSHYVRARHYSKASGAWCMVDPLWPNQSTYTYSSSMPTSRVDPTGLWNVGFTRCDSATIARITKRLNNINRPPPNDIPETFYECIDTEIDTCSSTHGRSTPSPPIKTWITNPPVVPPKGGSPVYDIIFNCRENCPDGGKDTNCAESHLGKPLVIDLCIPQALTGSLCGKLECTIMHELIHLGSNGIPHGSQNNHMWEKCMAKIPGCRWFD